MVYSTPKKRVLFVRRFTPVFIAVFGVFSLLALNLQSPKLAYATASDTVNFQARLQTAGGAIVADGSYNIEFKLYNATGSSSNPGSCTSDCVWSEDYTGANKVAVKNGYLSVQLGSQNALPTSLDWSQQLYLTMDIGGTGTLSWDGEMLPRLALTATPYSFLSQRALTSDNADQLSATNTNGTNTLSLQGPGSGAGGQNFVLQDQGATGTYYLLAENASGDVSVSGLASAANITTGSIDRSGSGTLSIGGTHASAISLGNTSSNIATTINGTAVVKPTSGNDTTGVFQVQDASSNDLIDVDSSTETVNLGAVSAAIASTVNVATSTTTGQTVNIASGIITSGTNTVNIATGASSTGKDIVTIGSLNNASSTTVQGGSAGVSVAAASGATIGIGTSANNVVTIGNSTSGTNAVTLQAEGIAQTITGSATNPTSIIQTSTNSTAAFQVQDSGSKGILTVDTTSGGTVIVGNSTNGGQLVNYGSTLNTAKNILDVSGGGSIGSAATTVDIYTTFAINQTTPGQTLSLDNPNNATAGRIVYVINTGTTSFTMGGVVIGIGTNASFLWNASTWTATAVSTGVSIVGSFGGSLTNGASISGNTITFGAADGTNPGMVSTGAQTFGGAKTFSALITGSAGATIGGGAIALTGNNNSTFTTTSGTLTLQGAGATTVGTANAGGATTSGLTLSTGNVTSGSFASGSVSIDVGTSTGTRGTVSIGTANASGVTIGNTGGSLTLEGSNAGTIAIGNSANAHTINIGAGSGANNTTVAIGSGVTGGSNTASVTIGSANAAASTTTIQGGNGSGAVSIQAAASGTISIGSTNDNNLALGTAAVGGTITVGGTGTTAAITIGQSTATNEIDLGNAVTGSGNTQTIKIGTGATGTGISLVTIGATSSGSQTKLQGGAATLTVTNNGGAAIQGAGSTSGTTAFSVSNSGSANLAQILDDGSINLGKTTSGSSGSYGNTGIGNTQGTNYFNGSTYLMSAQRITASSGGTVSSLSTYVSTSSVTCTGGAFGGINSSPNNLYQLAIYADNGSGTGPGSYVASTSTSSLTGGWNTASVTNGTAALSAGTMYWIVYWTNTNGVNNSSNGQCFNSGSGNWVDGFNAWQCSSSCTNGMPNTFPGGGSSGSFNFSIYASYSTSGVTPVTINSSGVFSAALGATIGVGSSGESGGQLLTLDSDTDAAYSAGSATGAPTEVNGAMFYSSTSHSFMCGVAGAWETCNGLLYSNTAASSAISTCTNTCASFSTAAPIPANYCQAGRVIHIIARGVYNTAASTTPTIAMGLYYGTNASTRGSDTQLGVTTQTSSNLSNSLVNAAWQADFTIICFSTSGGSSTINAQGSVVLELVNGSGAAATTVSQETLYAPTTTNQTSVTTSSANNLYLFPTLVSNANNNMTLEQLIVTGN